MEQYLLVAMVLAVFMIVAAIFGFFAIREVYSRRYAEDQNGVRTQSVVEDVLYEMLQNETVPRRKFEVIKNRIGGLADDEIRRILLRLGAVRFLGGNSGEEYWGLLERNREALLTDVEKSIRAGEKLILPESDEETVSIVSNSDDIVRIDQGNKSLEKITKTKLKSQTKNKRIMASSPDFTEVLSVVQDTTLFDDPSENEVSNGNENYIFKEKAAE